MDRIIYKYTNQHRHGKYFQKLKIVRNKIKFIVKNNCKRNIDVKHVEYVKGLAVSTAEMFTILLGRSYFMPFSLVCISIMAKIVSILTDLKCILLKDIETTIVDTAKVVKKSNDSSDNDVNTDVFEDKNNKQNEITSMPTINTTHQPSNLLDTSIDSLLTHNHNTTDNADSMVYGEQFATNSRKRKKKKKKKKDRKKGRLNDNEMYNKRDEIDDIFGF